MADETGLDFSDQINALELKYQHVSGLHLFLAFFDVSYNFHAFRTSLYAILCFYKTDLLSSHY